MDEYTQEAKRRLVELREKAAQRRQTAPDYPDPPPDAEELATRQALIDMQMEDIQDTNAINTEPS